MNLQKKKSCEEGSKVNIFHPFKFRITWVDALPDLSGEHLFLSLDGKTHHPFLDEKWVESKRTRKLHWNKIAQGSHWIDMRYIEEAFQKRKQFKDAYEITAYPLFTSNGREKLKKFRRKFRAIFTVIERYHNDRFPGYPVMSQRYRVRSWVKWFFMFIVAPVIVGLIIGYCYLWKHGML